MLCTGPTMSGDDESSGQMITVFSPKGGVGKTTIAVNLAIALSDNNNKKVCLVDLDLGFGDVAITLQMFPARTIADAVHLGERPRHGRPGDATHSASRQRLSAGGTSPA